MGSPHPPEQVRYASGNCDEPNPVDSISEKRPDPSAFRKKLSTGRFHRHTTQSTPHGVCKAWDGCTPP
jgi:hypothetical protein